MKCRTKKVGKPIQKKGARIIKEWPRGEREVVRLYLHRFNRRDLISLRVLFKNDEGDFCSTKKGVDLDVKKLPALAEGLKEALKRAKKKGLLE